MRVYSAEKIKEIKKFRKVGYSINELVREFSIPKTTVWHHIHNVKVLPRYCAILKAKQSGSAKRKQRRLLEAEEEAKKILYGPHRNYAIILAMLHWCEGSKKVCEFINSDSQMVK